MSRVPRQIIYDPAARIMSDEPKRVRPGASLVEALNPLAAALPRVIDAKESTPRASDSRHVHVNIAELRLYLAGTGSIRIAGINYDWRAGDLVVMEPGDEHQTLAAQAGGRMLSLHLWCPRQRRQAEARVAWLAQRLHNVRHVRLGLAHPAVAALQRAASAVASGALGDDLVAGCAVAETLLLLGREGSAPADRGALLVAAVQAHIARRYADEPGIDALLAPYDLHPNYLRGIFKRATGMSIRDAWLKARITAAQPLLRSGELPLADVALQVGFADYQAFARRFRAITGLSPSAWRALA